MRRPVAAALRGALALATAAGAGAPALAQLTVTPTVRAQVTWSDNAALKGEGGVVEDVITSITPGLFFEYRGPNMRLDGGIALSSVVYANGAAEDRLSPLADIGGELTLVRNLLFVDVRAQANDIYYSPFGPTPDGTLPSTENRYRAQYYRISPRIEGEAGGNITYRFVDDNIWTAQTGEPVEIRRTYTNRFLGTVERQPRPLGWGVDVERNDYQIQGRDNQERMLMRARGMWQPHPQLEVFAGGGYEDNKFPLSEQSGAIYGAGLRWAPTQRTSLDARWEHRFFGGSYDVSFEHRAVQSVWQVQASRNITTYPETIGQLPAGTNVAGVLDQLLLSRIPDETQRTEFIRTFMDQRGIPLILDDALALYNEQVYLQERALASVGLLGVRNTVLFSAYRLRTQPITGTGQALPPLPFLQTDNTQIGGNVTWSYRFAPLTTATLSLDARRTEANPPLVATTEEQIAKLTISHALTARTTLFGGLRHQRFRTDFDVFGDWDENAVFAGITYTFR